MSVLRTALYCRLSKDDMVQGDSESIKTQKAMLTPVSYTHLDVYKRQILRQNRLRYISIIVSFSVALPPHPGLLQRTAKTKRRKALSMGMWNSGQSRAREHMPQIPARFPAAPNVLALPGGNGIFTATLTERITHYTLLRKVVCQGASPFGIPDNKTGCIFPLRGYTRCV